MSDVHPAPGRSPEEMERRREMSRQIARSMDRSMLLLCALVIGMSLLLHPGVDFVYLGSWQIPTLCVSRRVLGIECPGCGLTRSFVFLSHLSPILAWQANKLGIPMYALVFSQIPFRLWRLWR